MVVNARYVNLFNFLVNTQHKLHTRQRGPVRYKACKEKEGKLHGLHDVWISTLYASCFRFAEQQQCSRRTKR